MNWFERLLWKTKLNIIRAKMHLYTIAGRPDLVDREFQKCKNMLAAYYNCFLS